MAKRKVSKRLLLSPVERQKQDLQQTVKNVNKRLNAVSKLGDKWAAKNLKARSTGKINIWKKGKIDISSINTKKEVEAVRRSLDLFLEAKTSTKEGIRQAEENVRKGIKGLTKASDETVEKIYDFLSDPNFRSLQDKIDDSATFVLLAKAIEQNDSEDKFMRRMDMYIDYGNDEDMIEALQEIYEDYVS